MKLSDIWHKSAPTVVGVIFALSVVGVGATAYNSWQVRQSQEEHTTDLQTIKALETQVATEGEQIEGYARSLEAELRSSHGASYGVLVQLCQETPGCTVPQ